MSGSYRPRTPNINLSPNIRANRAADPGSAFDIYLKRAEGASPSVLAERTGATQGEVQRRALQPNYEAYQTTAQLAGVEDSKDKPALMTALEFIARPGSALVGAMSGFRGETIYRPGESPDEVARGELNTAAARRFREGLSGEQYYSWSMVGPTAKRLSEEESFPGYAGAANLAKGIVLDTVFDPITYLSFGGSIMGRAVAARRVSSEANRILRSYVEDATFDAERFLRNNIDSPRAPISARGVSNRYQNLARRQSLNEDLPQGVRDIYGKARFQPTNNVDEVFTQSRLIDDEIFQWYDKFDDIKNMRLTAWTREIALETMPDIAAAQYHLRSAAGLRRWAINTFGDDTGNAFFTSLPHDIQGGIRIRAPFLRSLDGDAIATKPIFGAGRLGDGLEKLGIKTLNQFWNAAESTRDTIRAVLHAVPGSRHLMFKGRAGEQLADALLGATGKRYRFFYNDEGSFRLFGKKTGAYVDYVDYAAFDKGVHAAMGRAQHFNSQQERMHYVATGVLQGALQNKSPAEQRKVAEAFWDYLGDRIRMKTDWEGLAQGRSLTPAEEAAIRPAWLFAQMMDDYGAEAVAITKNSRRAVRSLNNYAPRRQRAAERRRRSDETMSGFGPAGSPVDDAFRQRTHDVSVYDLSEEGNVVSLRFKGPHQSFRLNNGVYEEKYLTDPVAAMADYINNVTRTIDDLRLASILDESGIWTRQQRRAFQTFDENIIEEDLVRLIGSRDGKVTGRIERLRQRLVDDFDLLDDKGQVVRRVEDMSPKRIEELGAFLADEATVRGAVSPHSMHLYNMVPDQPGVYVNPVDNTRLVHRAGVFEVFDHRNQRILDDAGQPLIFKSKQQAELALKENPDILAARVALYNNKVAVDFSNLTKAMDDVFKNRPRQWGSMFYEIDKKYADGLIDAPTHHGLKESMLRRAFENLEFMGMGGEIREPIKGTTETRLVRAGARNIEYKPLESIIDYATKNELANLNNVVVGSTRQRTTQRDIQARVLEHLGEVYAPQATAESVSRMFEVYRSPETVGRFLWETVYLPYFSMIKAQLTLLRGTGFVARNLLGGSYNNWINGVGVEQTTAAAEVIGARILARSQFQKKYGQNWYLRQDLDPATAESELHQLFLGNLRKKYKDNSGTFIEGMNDAEALIELWSAAFNNGAVGASRSTRLATEIGVFGPSTRGSAWDATTSAQRRKMLGQYVETLGDATSTIDVIPRSQQHFWVKGMNWLGTENPIIRNVMGPLQSTSEDYLRFAAYLKGVKELGLEPLETGLRGYGASQWVKATQFDYADLSYFEQAYLKNIMPFYIWTRNNIPMQLRAFIHQPGRIQSAYRIHRNLGMVFSDDEGNGPRPDYLDMGMMNLLPDRVTEKLPDWLRPQGLVAYGPAHMDPMIDANRWFNIPGRGRKANPLNWINKREFAQNINPLINTIYEAFVSPLDQGVDYSGRGYSNAPGWANNPVVRNIPGLTRIDYSEPDQPLEMNRTGRAVITSAFPLMQHMERYLNIPGLISLGDERQQGRTLTTLVSAIAGLPVATVDAYQFGGQMQRDTERLKRYLEEEFGDTAQYRKDMVHRLLSRGAPLEFIEQLDIANLPRDEVDVLRAQHAWELYRLWSWMIENGVPEEDVLAVMWIYTPEGSGSRDLIQAIWDAVPGMAAGRAGYRPLDGTRTVMPATDARDLRRMFDSAPATPSELEVLGYTQADVDRMSDDDKIRLVLVPLLNLRGLSGDVR